MSYQRRIQERIQDPTKVDKSYIQQCLNEDKEVIIQFSDVLYNDKILNELNELCLKHDENLIIRFFGHYGKSFDCGIVKKIPNVKSLSVDCLIKAHNIESIAQLKNLKRLCIGIYELKDTEILGAENFRNLNRLFIVDTKTKALNLEYLKNYQNLNYLIIAGHTKNIDAVGELKKLESLSLNSVSKVPLTFINHLDSLKTLRIILGGRENINEINGNEIEQLDLIWIRGLNDVSNMSRFKKLKTFSIEDQIRLAQIDFHEPLPELTYLRLINCKTLTKLRGLEKFQKLDHLRIARTAIDFESFIEQPLPQSLKTFAFYTSKEKIDRVIKASLEKMGYQDGLSRG